MALPAAVADGRVRRDRDGSDTSFVAPYLLDSEAVSRVGLTALVIGTYRYVGLRIADVVPCRPRLVALGGSGR